MDHSIHKLMAFKNTAEIKACLSDEFWTGKRWVAYRVPLKRKKGMQLACFETYEKAAVFCRKVKRRQGHYTVNAISIMLRFLNKVIPPATDSQKEWLKKQLALYSLVPTGNWTGFLENLLNGCYCPVLWPRSVLPLTHILSYLVKLRDCKTGWETIYNGPDFFKALAVFQKTVTVFQGSAENMSLKVCLAGLMDSAGWQGQQEKPLVFYLFEEKKGQQGVSGALRQLNDPAEPVWLPVVQFIRYHMDKQCISFYDDGLRKALPGLSCGYLDCSDFDYGQQFKTAFRNMACQ